MDLSIAEIIQILRKRARLNQGDFGAKAFGKSFEAGRTKVKNIELGKQKPTPADLANISKTLNVPLTVLNQDRLSTAGETLPPEDAFYIDKKVLKFFPDLDAYIDMLNKAVSIEDMELIDHLAGKISTLFTSVVDYKAAVGDHV